MKKFLPFFLIFFAVSVLLMLGLIKKVPGESYRAIIYSTSGDKMYPEEILLNKNSEEKIVSAVLKESSFKLISTEKKDSYIYIIIDGRIDKNSDKDKLLLRAIESSLTALPNIKGTVVTDGTREKFYGTRDRKLTCVTVGMSPAEVIGEQMKCEKERKWLRSYLMLSDEYGSDERKSYDQYYREMLESYEQGLMSAEFHITGYNITDGGKRAKVGVEFISNDYGSSKVYFNCIRLDGNWYSEWVTAQR